MIELRSPALQADSLPAEPQGKPKNTGVGSLSLLQWICQTQESSWGCLHCRWTLYQLSYQGSLGTYTRSGIYTCFWFPLENNDPFWSYCSQLNYHFFIDSQAKKKKKSYILWSLIYLLCIETSIEIFITELVYFLLLLLLFHLEYNFNEIIFWHTWSSFIGLV